MMQRLWAVWIAAALAQLALAAQAAGRELACPAERPQCTLQGRGGSELFFRVNNTQISITTGTIQLTLKCLNNSGLLDVAALPRYEQAVVFDEVFIQSCVLGNASVPAVLSALNASVTVRLVVEGVKEALRADQFTGLSISSLKLARESPQISVQLKEDFFSAFQNLTKLNTVGIQYDRPPSGLLMWSTENAELTRLYAECVSSLEYLSLVEPELRDVSALSAATRLSNLSLWAPVGELPPPPALPALLRLELHYWNVSRPQWPGAPQLDELKVVMSEPAQLPGPWLSASPRLQKLELRNLPLLELPERLLHANPELRELTIVNCGLTSDMLADTFLDKNVKLEKLDLSRNNLTTLPSDRLFAHLPSLAELNLSHNRLRVPPGAADGPAFLSGHRALRVLQLDANPLGDTCAAVADAVRPPALSWLRELSGLRALSLRRTRARRLCADWLGAMPQLADLDLRYNDFTELTFSDLQAVRSAGAGPLEVRLQRNPRLRHVRYSQLDVLSAATQKGQVIVSIDTNLTCDCDLYLFAKALQLHPEHAHVQPLRCELGPLRLLPLDALQCGADCGAGCRCREVPARGGLVAHCDGLPERLARPRPDGVEVVELSLAGAGLAALPAAGALPPRLRLLDVRNNSIAGAARADARALLARSALRLLLAGNPLQCGCGRRELVDLLLQYKDRVDFAELSCSDGSAPAPAECGLAAGLVALLGVLGALALGGALLLGALAHPRARARLKAALRVLGVRLPRAAEPARRYDAFVSFAEADARWVAATLVPALEGGPRPRRLCLHYRDWAVGELIPRQIAASVRDARRTLLVVSDAFARSAWARAEFDEAMAAAARDGRPPPLAVLLAPPAPAALAAAPALADYLAAATYLRADDPRFRHKLRQAVPAGRLLRL